MDEAALFEVPKPSNRPGKTQSATIWLHTTEANAESAKA